MKRQSPQNRGFLASWFWGEVHPILAVLASGVLLASVFGLRDIILTPALVAIFDEPRLANWLQPVYWLALGLSGLTLFFYARANPPPLPKNLQPSDILIWLFLASPFLYLTLTRRLVLDFWLDEMMSIVRHIQPSISSALLWYPVPNNHVFANFLGGLYVQLIGLRELGQILENPVVLRLLYLVTGLGTILLLPYIAQREYGKRAGWLAVVLLTTTIPFLNFMVQVRGYSLTLFLASLLVLLTLRYRERNARADALGIALLVCFLFFTIVSNLYFLLALLAFYALDGLVDWRRGQSGRWSLRADEFVLYNPGWTLAVMVAAGLLLALVFYLPIFEQVFDNRYVTSEGLFQGTVWFDAFPRTMGYFASNRGLLFLAAGFGVLLGWAKARRRRDERTRYWTGLLLAAVFFPYLISFIRGDNPFERTFLVTLPAFILLAAFGLEHLIRWVAFATGARRWPAAAALVLVGLASYGAFFTAYRGIEAEIYANLVDEDIKQIELYDSRLWASHFLDHFQVLPAVRAALPGGDIALPVLVDMNDTRYPWVLTEYFRAWGVAVQEIEAGPVIAVPAAYVLVSYPERSLAEFQTRFPEAECTLVTEEISIYRTLYCEFGAPQ